MRSRQPLAVPLAVLFAALAVRADDPSKGNPEPLVVVDNGGKEHTLKNWKFTLGTRRLGWLAVKEGAKEPVLEPREVKGGIKTALKNPKDGPEALEFREEKSTKWVPGVLTLVPVSRIRSLEIDNDKKVATLKVAAGAKAEDVVLTGVTKFTDSNKFNVSGDEDKGDMGVAAAKFFGGVKGGFKAVRPPAPKAEDAVPPGRPAVVTLDDQKTSFPVDDLLPLYRCADGTERAIPVLMFKKSLKVDVRKVRKISVEGKDTWQVTFKDGEEQTLTLLRTVTLDGKEAELQGLVGRVPAGYKLFPPNTLGQVEFDAAEKKPETPK